MPQMLEQVFACVVKAERMVSNLIQETLESITAHVNPTKCFGLLFN